MVDYSKWDHLEEEDSEEEMPDMRPMSLTDQKVHEWESQRLEDLERQAADLQPWQRDLVSKPKGAVVFMHGSGDSGAGIQAWLGHAWEGDHGDFEDTMSKHRYRVLFPDSGARPYTLAGGAPMPVWFDRSRMAFDAPEDDQGIQESVEKLDSLVDELIADGVPASNIFVGGFSMGGAMGLQLALRSRHQYAGCFMLSSFMASGSTQWSRLGVRCTIDEKGEEVSWERTPGAGDEVFALAKRVGRVLVSHGTDDSLIAFDWGEATAQGLEEAGIAVQFERVPGLGHELGEAQVQALVDWIEELLGKPADAAEEELPPGAAAAQQADGAREQTSGTGHGSGAMKAASPRRPGSAGVKTGGERQDGVIRFRVSPAGSDSHTAVFTVPQGWEEALAKYPVHARGASFDLQPGKLPGTIQSSFTSSSPEETAEAIKARLEQRLRDPAPPGAEDCCIM